MADIATRPARRCVLVVDDEEPNRVLMSALLTAQGYETRVARDGPSALLELERGDVALVLLDMMMPGMDGLEVCRRAREQPEGHEVTIVFLTALSDRDSRHRAKAAGADDFLVKPVEGFELSFRVSNWLKMRRLTEHNQRLTHRLTSAQQTLREVARTFEALTQQPDPQRFAKEQERLQDMLQACVQILSTVSEDA